MTWEDGLLSVRFEVVDSQEILAKCPLLGESGHVRFHLQAVVKKSVDLSYLPEHYPDA